MSWIGLAIVLVPIVVMSIVLHEVAHGWAALYFGDDTAKRAGRLTLNPLPHLDLFGSIFLPLFCLFIGAPIFAWAKPVPVNFDNIFHRRGEICVSLAGVAVNFLIAVIAGLILRLVGWSASGAIPFFTSLLYIATQINLILGVFNLLPVPPLDGWRLWGVWLPAGLRLQMEMNAMIFLILLILFLPYLPIWLIIKLIFTLITGIR